MGMDRMLKKKRWTPRRIADGMVIAGYMMLVLSPLIFRMGKAIIGIKARRLTISEVVLGPLQDCPPVIGEAVKYLFRDVLMRND